MNANSDDVVKRTRLQRWALCAIALVLAASAVVRIAVVVQTEVSQPDEILAPGVLRWLETSHTLDTNWKLADVPRGYKGPQYNFSGYFITLFGMRSLVHAVLPEQFTADSMRELRCYSVVLAIAGMTVVVLLGFTVGGYVAALAATLLIATSPSLLMDAFYARPETLYVFLCLVLLLSYLYRTRFPNAWLPGAGLLVGFLVSIKVSALVFAVLLVPGVWRGGLRGLLIAVVCSAVGFVAGAPGAAMHPGDYMEGIGVLRRTYAGGFPPHGLGAGASLLERMAYAALWMWQTWGVAWMAVAIGVWELGRMRRWDALFAFAPFAITIAYFMSTPAFLERNLAPGLAAFTVLAGLGIERLASIVRSRSAHVPGAHALAAVGLLLLVLLMPFLASDRVLRAAYFPYDLKDDLLLVAKSFDRDVVVLGWARPSWDHIPMPDDACNPPIIEALHAGDQRSLAWLAEGKAKGWREVRRHDSWFAGYVPSTFHTYLSASSVFMMKDPRAMRPADRPCGEIRWAAET